MEKFISETEGGLSLPRGNFLMSLKDKPLNYLGSVVQYLTKLVDNMTLKFYILKYCKYIFIFCWTTHIFAAQISM